MEIFRSMLYVFFPFFSVSLTELCSFWYGLKDLFTLHKLADIWRILHGRVEIRNFVSPSGHVMFYLLYEHQ